MDLQKNILEREHYQTVYEKRKNINDLWPNYQYADSIDSTMDISFSKRGDHRCKNKNKLCLFFFIIFYLFDFSISISVWTDI